MRFLFSAVFGVVFALLLGLVVGHVLTIAMFPLQTVTVNDATTVSFRWSTAISGLIMGVAATAAYCIYHSPRFSDPQTTEETRVKLCTSILFVVTVSLSLVLTFLTCSIVVDHQQVRSHDPLGTEVIPFDDVSQVTIEEVHSGRRNKTVTHQFVFQLKSGGTKKLTRSSPFVLSVERQIFQELSQRGIVVIDHTRRPRPVEPPPESQEDQEKRHAESEKFLREQLQQRQRLQQQQFHESLVDSRWKPNDNPEMHRAMRFSRDQTVTFVFRPFKSDKDEEYHASYTRDGESYHFRFTDGSTLEATFVYFPEGMDLVKSMHFTTNGIVRSGQDAAIVRRFNTVLVRQE